MIKFVSAPRDLKNDRMEVASFSTRLKSISANAEADDSITYAGTDVTEEEKDDVIELLRKELATTVQVAKEHASRSKSLATELGLLYKSTENLKSRNKELLSAVDKVLHERDALQYQLEYTIKREQQLLRKCNNQQYCLHTQGIAIGILRDLIDNLEASRANKQKNVGGKSALPEIEALLDTQGLEKEKHVRFGSGPQFMIQPPQLQREKTLNDWETQRIFWKIDLFDERIKSKGRCASRTVTVAGLGMQLSTEVQTSKTSNTSCCIINADHDESVLSVGVFLQFTGKEDHVEAAVGGSKITIYPRDRNDDALTHTIDKAYPITANCKLGDRSITTLGTLRGRYLDYSTDTKGVLRVKATIRVSRF